MDIRNKEIRKELIVRYLDAETSLSEEKLLVGYYWENEVVDEDEQDIARMIRMDYVNTALLSDEGADEYDRIVKGTTPKIKRISVRWIAWASGIAAAIALFFMLNASPSSSLPNTTEIAQSIQQMMNLDTDGIVSISAVPVDECVWIKAELEDGTVKTFIMSKDKEGNTTSLLAIN